MLVMGGGGGWGGGGGKLSGPLNRSNAGVNFFFSKLIDMARQCKICINKYP